MKRKASDDIDAVEHKKKRDTSPKPIKSRFRHGLFDETQLKAYTQSYSNSEPYKHGVIPSLISSDLLRAVRSEIQGNLSFTPKETDIYRIHQSGDLANLDGLDDSSLQLLPSLLSLRDALYSPDFRSYLSNITGAGKLSGKKTDMAVNVYTPGCHLLCHDDVIGTRRVSYILYLTDPDEPWEAEWGGALRLYPTLEAKVEGEGEKVCKVPSPDESVRIPPAFGQLSFFAVQPGESFHDVEEVYAETGKGDEALKENKKRVRTAISGWYHIPQEGEEGYEPGLEEKLTEKSSLMQLQGKADQFDLPRPTITPYDKEPHDHEESATQGKQPAQEVPLDEEPLSESDLEFLLKYLAPTYLTPDTLESVAAAFTDQFTVLLDNILSRKFCDTLRAYILDQETESLPTASTDIESKTSWKVARPPHKHRFLFQQPTSVASPPAPSSAPLTPPASFSEPGPNNLDTLTPIQDLLTNLLPSSSFRKWLELATNQTLLSHNLLARRFRRGKDYTLATGYDSECPRIEITLATTPTKGWADEEEEEEEEEEGEEKEEAKEAKEEEKEAESQTSKKEKVAEASPLPEAEAPGVGGYLAYMAGDDDAAGSDSDDGVQVPPSLSTGAQSVGPKKEKAKSDPAVYKAATDPEDGGVLFSMPAGWNSLGIVLRDQGTMRFVKYVSAAAKGDRWDLVGEFEIVDNGDEAVDEEDEGGDKKEEDKEEVDTEIDTEVEAVLEHSSDESSI